MYFEIGSNVKKKYFNRYTIYHSQKSLICTILFDWEIVLLPKTKEVNTRGVRDVIFLTIGRISVGLVLSRENFFIGNFF